MRLEALVPVFETSAAIGIQLLIGGEEMLTRFLDGFIKFAEVIGIIPTDPWALVINIADTTFTQMGTTRGNVQEPSISVFEDIDVFVRNLPQ